MQITAFIRVQHYKRDLQSIFKKKKVNRICKTQVAATSQTQWMAFTYPALMSRQDLWQIPFAVVAQGAVLHLHSLGAACFDVTSLHFPLICDSRSERMYKSWGCLSEQISWKHPQHQHSASYLNQQPDGQSLVHARLLPFWGKESVRGTGLTGDFASIEQHGANRC